MKVLVTGGAGYIGSVATERLISNGYEVVVLDSFYMGHREAVHPQAAFVEADLSDKAAVDAAFREHRPEAVMHFASHTLVGESMQHPFLYLGDNVRNALNLLEVMVEHGVGKIILSSTANLFEKPESMPIGPDERVIPGSPYGESKAIIERFLHWLQVTKGLRYACLRYFNAAGATAERGEDHTPETHLIPLVLQVALGQRDAIKIFGGDYPTPDGTCVRDYIHIADLADAHILSLQALETRPVLTYNLGNGNGFSVKEVVDTARRITGHAIPVEIVDRRPGDPAVLVADATKIKAELGWAPQFPDLQSIIQSAWNWHNGHPRGYAG
ncbi:MAG TPA: UDP-glucose 4-epimerase GalE [Verrucomicrobiales bacterium]|nr:UDP-glucose 4-epimerase GalE [Verrucomicrobiae bacterium]MCP5553283.1 UDP-glucose 4-epimerase GalE [Akkermansiaceae bacterium]HRX54586.1 UDP-glucose 4-epimerase GalE [Verrucomicrobiales bacterium]